MRPITRNLFRILNNDKLQPVELLEIRLLGTSQTSALHFTNYGEELTWGGQTYTAVAMSRGGYEDILSAESGEVPVTTVTMGNVDTKIAALLNTVELAGAIAILRVADRRYLTRPRDAMILALGEIQDPSLSEQTLVFQIANIIAMLDRQLIPRRIWQQNCNYTFGSRACGVNIKRQPFSIQGTVQTGTTSGCVIVEAATAATAASYGVDEGSSLEMDEFWAGGYVMMLDGSAATQARPFQHYDNQRVYLRQPFLVAPEAGDTYLIRRGCRKTKQDCRNRAGAYTNYGGFAEVPYGQIKPEVASMGRDE